MKTKANRNGDSGGNDAWLVGARTGRAQDHEVAQRAQQDCAPTLKAGPSQPCRNDCAGLWLGVALAFALLLGAYTVFAVVAARHPVAEVPLATAPRSR